MSDPGYDAGYEDGKRDGRREAMPVEPPVDPGVDIYNRAWDDGRAVGLAEARKLIDRMLAGEALVPESEMDTPEEGDSSRGVDLIVEERVRQVREEGFTADHDHHHSSSQLAWAAVAYAAPGQVYRIDTYKDAMHLWDPWPWDDDWDKRGKFSRLRELVVAGALIAAEIDRRLRNGETMDDEPAHRLGKVDPSR